jgi:hypothetical protein
MAKPTYTPPIGGLATNRYDFQTHIEGLSFRHSADQIDLIPAIVINGVSYVTVADALAATSASISQLISNGEGFVTIGDGYDSWHNANGTINFDPTVPSLDTILNPIFNAIYTNTGLPAQYERIQRGGIVVIKSGTYYVLNTINVPPGIVIFGEGYGTKIVNATSLVIPPTSGSPPYPKVTSTAAPVFKILPDINRINNDGAINSNLPYFMFERVTKIMNLVIGDNFIEPTILGDLNYKLAQNYAVNTPLVLQEPGSHLECDHVVFVGRANFSSGQSIGTNGVTSYPIQLDPANPVSTGTILKVKDCFIDGFALGGEFRGIGYNADKCEYVNNKIRVYGYLANDSSAAIHNSILSTTACNILFNNNYIVGNGNNVKYGVYVDINGVSAPASKNLMPRAEVTGNSGVVNNTAAYASVSNNFTVSIFGTNESVPQTVILATVANNTFGSDSSGQRTIVPSTAALQQIDDSTLAAGSVVWVGSNEEHFYLDRGTNATGLSADGINIFTTASGTGKWIRLLYLNYGNAQINGNLTVNGMISGTISGGSSQPGNFSVGGNLSLTGSLIPTTGTLTVSGSENIGDNLTVVGTTTLNTGAVAISPTIGISYTTTNQLTFTSVGAGRTTLTSVPSNTGNSNAITTYKNNTTGAYEIAANCYWGLIGATSDWISYDTSKQATLVTIGSSLNTGVNGNFMLKTRSPGAGNWSDASWDTSEQYFAWTPGGSTGSGLWTYRQSSLVLAGANMVDSSGNPTQPHIQITGNPGHLNLGVGGALQNTLYADNITKAWGSFTVPPASQPTGYWFGINSITYSGASLDPVHIVLTNAIPIDIINGKTYNITCTCSNFDYNQLVVVTNVTTTSFDIFIYDGTLIPPAGQLSFQDFSDTIYFTVNGQSGG